MRDAATGAVEGLHLSQVDGVGIIRLSRPPVNALTFDLLAELAEVVSRPDVWFSSPSALSLTADGPDFSAGMDREELEHLTRDALTQAAADLGAVLHRTLPMVAGVEGAAVGTGFILAACSDILVVAPDAEMRLPEVELGVLGGAGHARRWLPMGLVRRMVLTGEKISGRAMHEYGALPPDRDTGVAETALRIAQTLAARPAGAVASARTILSSLEPDAAATHRDEMERTSAMQSTNPGASA